MGRGFRNVAIAIIIILGIGLMFQQFLKYEARRSAEDGRKTMLYFDTVKQQNMEDLSEAEILHRFQLAKKAFDDFTFASNCGMDVEDELKDAEMKADMYFEGYKEKLFDKRIEKTLDKFFSVEDKVSQTFNKTQKFRLRPVKFRF